jgi:tetratricopeptide (TPR) repeat protein
VPEPVSPPRPRSVAAAAVLVGLLAVAVYLPALRHGFIWDDPIVLDRQLPYFDGPFDAFFPPPGVPQWGAHYYRPMVVLSYQADELLARVLSGPEGRRAARQLTFHASPVLLHGIASALVVALGAALMRRVRPEAWSLAVPLAAGLLFAVHPIHVESVAWLAGRSDLLCAVFALGALAAWLRWLEARRAIWLPLTAALALAAMLSKEVGLALVALLPLAAWLPRRPNADPTRLARSGWREPALGAALAAGAAALALGLRGAAASPGSAPAIVWSDPLQRMLTALGWYGLKTVWPAPFSAFVDRVPESLPLAALGLLLAAGALALIYLGCARGRRGAEAFAAALYLLALVPALAVAAGTIAATPLAERYLYLPSAGAALLLALGVDDLARRRTARHAFAIVVGTAAALAVVALPATLQRQRVWRDDLSFWSDAASKAPSAWLPQDALGTALADAGRADDAAARFRRAAELAVRPHDRARVRTNLGTLLARQQRWDEAIAAFRAALADDPQLDTAHANLAQALLARYAARPAAGDKVSVMEEAARHLDAARQLDPRQASRHFAYGMLMVELGRAPEAAAPLREVIALAPNSPEAATARRVLDGGTLR